MRGAGAYRVGSLEYWYAAMVAYTANMGINGISMWFSRKTKVDTNKQMIFFDSKNNIIVCFLGLIPEIAQQSTRKGQTMRKQAL